MIRDKKVVENFTGSSKKTTRVAENIVKNYSPNNTSNVDNLSTSITPRDKYLKRIQENQVNTSADNLNNDSINAQSNFFSQNNQLFNNNKTINGYYGEYNSNDNKLEGENEYLNNYERIVNDSNTVLLQENRIYIFLFILLILCLIIFIQVIKLNKQ
jgi:maltodextrin utilization protein YvdJ